MDVVIALINGLSSGLIACGLIAAALSRRVHDGVVIKIGLCSMALGFVVLALHMAQVVAYPDFVNVRGLERAMLLINSGIAVVIIGYLFRRRFAGHSLRRITDWADLGDEPGNGKEARS